MEDSKNPQTLSNKNKQASKPTKDPNQKISDDTQISNQTSQISSSYEKIMKDSLASSTIQDEFVPRKDLEFAFTCLSNWESSYDGVNRIWELIKNEPDIDLDDYFDSLDFTQKCFLISGLNAHKDDEKMESLAPIIDRLDDRITNETKSDRVQRAAQLVGEKMSELIKTESPKNNRIRESNSGASLRSSPPSISSKITTTPRGVRPSQSSINESSISSKTQSRTSNSRANISSNASTSSRLSKTPSIAKSSSNAPTTAFGFSVRRTKMSTPSNNDDTSTSSNLHGQSSTSSRYTPKSIGSNYQNSITPNSRFSKKPNQDNNLTSPQPSSIHQRTSNTSTTKTHRSKL